MKLPAAKLWGLRSLCVFRIRLLLSLYFPHKSYLKGQAVARGEGSNFYVYQGLAFVLILGMGILGCQRAYIGLPNSGRQVARQETLSRLRSLESSLKGMQGVADLGLSTPAGLYRGKEIFSVELPDRFRFESLNFLGFSDSILCSDGHEIYLYLSSERKIIRGKASPESLRRISGAEIPLSCLLRTLMGQPPFPLDGVNGSWIIMGKSEEFVVGPAPVCQRLWIDETTQTLRQGEMIDEEGVWLSFQCKDYREINGFKIPFSFDMHLKRQRIRLQLIHRQVRTNPSFDADAFHLALPSTDEISILNLEDVEIGEDSFK